MLLWRIPYFIIYNIPTLIWTMKVLQKNNSLYFHRILWFAIKSYSWHWFASLSPFALLTLQKLGGKEHFYFYVWPNKDVIHYLHNKYILFYVKDLISFLWSNIHPFRTPKMPGGRFKKANFNISPPQLWFKISFIYNENVKWNKCCRKKTILNPNVTLIDW